jgi:hypothetical protein
MYGEKGGDAMEIPLEEIKSPPITRTSLEEDARQGSLHDSSPTLRFWARQKGWQETSQVGTALIDRMQVNEGKKAQ